MKLSFVCAIFLLGLSSAVGATEAVPLLVASHKLVRGLKNYLEKDNTEVHSLESAYNVIKHAVTQCSSEAYIIVDIPGLEVSDLSMTQAGNMPSLRKYLMLSSTLVGVPWVDGAVDMDFLEQYIINTCEAETILLTEENEYYISKYIDTRKRVIRIELPPITSTTTFAQKDALLRHVDLVVQSVLRAIPSPHFSLIVSSSRPAPLPNVDRDYIREHPEKYEIFSDILQHPSRAEEVERNDRFHHVEPYWSPDRNTVRKYLANRKKDEIHFFDPELWKKNEKLIISIFVITLSTVCLHASRIAWKICSQFSAKSKPILPHGKTD